ncbi:MAG: hypothetical protein KZQ70_15715 [gamma proteobacterium symbiont of Lucinoma myriamae]|nr:hypothetical protein [gamma proteobacterium symbiont of Lucinoma myriamae]MCU7817339.1 hypothetical protein [gamma proteobacterium symbiont of Lucinoma myriamae]MCU7833598.1 hypothetical protein [gamma proteobacterium symbiont of Lucinoma myriamae]
MTLERARELIAIQVDMGGGYNRNSVRVLLSEVSREHGQAGVDQLIREFALDEKFGLPPGQSIQP